MLILSQALERWRMRALFVLVAVVSALCVRPTSTALASPPDFSNITPSAFIDAFAAQAEHAPPKADDEFGRQALALKGRARLDNLQFFIVHIMGSTDDKTFHKWNDTLLNLATRENDHRYIDMAHLNDAELAYYEGDLSKYQVVEQIGLRAHDAYVKSCALLDLAVNQVIRGEIGEALKTLEIAHWIIPKAEPPNNYPLSLYWLTRGDILLQLGDIDGAAPALARAQFLYKPPGLGATDLDPLYNIISAARQLGDEALANKAYQASRRLALRSGEPLARAINQAQCARINSAFGRAREVLACLKDVDLGLIEPRYFMIDTLARRAVARAQTGQIADAQGDLAQLRRFKAAGLAPDIYFALIPRIEAQISAFQHGSRDAMAAEAGYWRHDEWIRAQYFKHSIEQLTGVLQLDLQSLRRTSDLQRTVIAFQWLLGALCLVVFAGCAIIVIRLRQLNAQNKAAKRIAEEANAAKSQFLANMSHEIRTPLNGILGMAQLISMDELSDRQKERCEILKNSSDALLLLLNDLLDLAKIEAGKLVLEMVEVDLVELIEGVRASFLAAAIEKGLYIDLAIDGAAYGLYRADPVRLRQILGNLISNALKFTHEGGVTISLSREDGALLLRVRDTGIGIEADAARRIFDKFEQADSTTTRRFGGTGLGLSITQELVTAFGGVISVESEMGAGAVFSLSLPLQRVGDARDEAAPDPAYDEPDHDDLRPLHVLAAEDHPVNRLVLEGLLVNLGCKVTFAEDGIETVAHFQSGSWDVILMDIQMPRMDGVEATCSIRQIETDCGLPRTPIIALTANAMSHQIEAYGRNGFDGHVAKPINADELSAALNRVLMYQEAAE